MQKPAGFRGRRNLMANPDRSWPITLLECSLGLGWGSQCQLQERKALLAHGVWSPFGMRNPTVKAASFPSTLLRLWIRNSKTVLVNFLLKR